MTRDGYLALMRDRGAACRFFGRKPEGKRPLIRPKHSWDNNIKMNLY
jgi:hypothetical protein